MLDKLDLTLKMKKAAYKAVIGKLRADLRDTQLALRAAGIPVVVLFEGWDAAGKGDSIGTLAYPMDPRGFKVHTIQAPNDEERYRPFLWRFWVRLPARGDLALFDRSWYRRLIEDRLDGEVSAKALPAAAAEIREFERQLTDDGVVLLKFWLHISKKEQGKRMRSIAGDRYERWRLTQEDWKRHRGHGKYLAAAEEMLALTSTANAPWTLVESTDHAFRRIKVLRTVLDALHRELVARGHREAGPAGGEKAAATRPGKAGRVAAGPAGKPGKPGSPAAAGQPVVHPRLKITGPPTILDQIDLSVKLSRAEYDRKLDRSQGRLRELCLECYRQRVPAIILYEGWDAAGKGGNIKRLTQELDPRGFDVIPIAAPDASEKARHYLYRFWRQIPKAGHVAIFDRSWYGRVLVERVEGFAKESEWRRAYQEINDFERHLTAGGRVLVKFWLQISPEEQLRRFEEREKTPWKQHKITAEDWRNRARWNAYRAAVAEMIERTSTTYAPWTVVEANDKLWARAKTLSTVVGVLEGRLKA